MQGTPPDTDAMRALAKSLWLQDAISANDKWLLDEAASEIERLRKDAARLDWFEEHPLRAELVGGAEDGHVGKAWAVAAHGGTLRGALDVLLGCSKVE